MIARLAAPRARRFSPRREQSSVGPLDGGVRTTSSDRPPMTFDQEMRAVSAARRAPLPPSNGTPAEPPRFGTAVPD
jgi:hypothetical protein